MRRFHISVMKLFLQSSIIDIWQSPKYVSDSLIAKIRRIPLLISNVSKTIDTIDIDLATSYKTIVFKLIFRFINVTKEWHHSFRNFNIIPILECSFNIKKRQIFISKVK